MGIDNMRLENGMGIDICEVRSSQMQIKRLDAVLTMNWVREKKITISGVKRVFEYNQKNEPRD